MKRDRKRWAGTRSGEEGQEALSGYRKRWAGIRSGGRDKKQ